LKHLDGNKVVFGDDRKDCQRQRQARLAALADKRAKGRLTLEDIDAKLDIIIEMLQEERDAR
jgi:hypothetical protein